MLCKRTMRAALAPVIGLFGVLLAMSAGAAIDLGERQGFISADPPNFDQNPPNRYAAETISIAQCQRQGARCAAYRVAATVGALRLTATTDILLPTGTQYYVRYNFTGGWFATDLVSGTSPDVSDLDVTPAGGSETGTTAVAYRGEADDNTVIFQLAEDLELPKGSMFELDLSGMADDVSTENINELLGNFNITGTGSATAEMAVYASLTGAVDESGALFEAGPAVIIQVDRVVGADVEPMVDVAYVSTLDTDGGPFRRFLPNGMGGKNVGVLAEVTSVVNQTGSRLWSSANGYRNASTGRRINNSIVASISAVASSDPGNFAIVSAGGDLIPGNKKPWRVSSDADCGDGELTLGVAGGDIEVHEDDPDGRSGHLSAGDPTPAGVASANRASGTAGFSVGTGYFCVLAAGNDNAIPEVGDPTTMDAYSLMVHPQLANADDKAFKPGAVGPKAAGAIDRDGTTVHLTYLSTHEAYNQRLVIVNRGSDAAQFWVDDASFNLEDGVTLISNTLQGMVPGNGRLVLRVQDEVTLDGRTRGAATINVASPTRDIDVMTIQVHPGTGQIDTTVYQHADE